MKSKKNLLASTIAFFVGSGMAPGVFAQADEAAAQPSQIDEIIVTASKRSAGQSIQDTAMAISALSGDTIEKRGLVGMDDYLRSIPGVSMQDRGAGQNSIVIRGLATDPQIEASTSSTYFGETPISDLGSASNTGSSGNADIKLVDIERIEVLRGPQGTLYGSGAMGGTVRVIPVAPNLTKLEGKLATRYSQTAEAGGDNTMMQAVLNVPVIEDTLAVRGVVYQFENSGFIDNVAASQPSARITNAVNTYGAIAEDRDDRGSDKYTGFRLTTLWKPSEELDITLVYLQQDIEQNGWPEVNLDLAGDYQHRRLNIDASGRSDEFLENDVELTNLVVNYDLGWGSLTSSSSWIDYNAITGADMPDAFLGGSPYLNDNAASGDVFVEELRLASDLEGPLQFVTGMYYEDRNSQLHTLWLWSGDPAQTPPAAQPYLIKLDNITTTTQKAFFGELSYSISDGFAVTIGGRYFDYDRELDSSVILFGNSLWTNQLTPTDETGSNYKAVFNYTPNEDILFYAQWSEGFRLGNGQLQHPGCTAIGKDITSIESDSTQNFEFGVKTAFADNRITLNASAYSIDWDDIPVFVNENGCPRNENAGKAKSQGIEIELQAQLTESLRWDMSASYVDATLEETSSIGTAGDPLPGSADYNASVAIQYDFTLANYNSFARIDYAYIGEYYNNLTEIGTEAGGFGQANLSLGVDIDQLSVNLFANNLTNENGLTWVETNRAGFSDDNSAYRIRPRTIGVNLSYQF